MTLTLNISPQLEARLRNEAARLGVTEAEYASRLLEQSLSAAAAPPAPADQATLDLLARWDAEDATDDPAELARRQREWERFKRAMNENSLSGRPVYP